MPIGNSVGILINSKNNNIIVANKKGHLFLYKYK